MQGMADRVLMVPNPYEPFSLGPVRDDIASLKRLRRASIFAAVRRRLDHGEKAVTLRALASDCGLSHQTIANLGGAGPRLIEASIVDYVAAITHHARHVSAPNAVLAWVDVCRTSWTLYPAYTIESTKIYYGKNPALMASLQRNGIRMMCLALKELRAEGKLREDFDLESAGSCVATIIPSLTYAWLNGAFGDAELRARVNMGVGGLLLAGASDAHGQDIRSWLYART